VRRFRALLSTMAVAGLCGCTATAEHRPHQSVTISSEPPGGACLLTGGAEPISEIAATPAVVRLPQSPRDVRVFCTSPGRAPVAAILPAETEAKQVAAAVLLYGAAPAAIATMMGAARSYAPKLDVTLPPMRFASAYERDRFFADRAEESRRHFDQPIRANKGMCRADEFGCQHMITKMERARDEELARLERLREATSVSP
jgi:hypothetical protein